jgi:hypothetical protein
MARIETRLAKVENKLGSDDKMPAALFIGTPEEIEKQKQEWIARYGREPNVLLIIED